MPRDACCWCQFLFRTWCEQRFSEPETFILGEVCSTWEFMKSRNPSRMSCDYTNVLVGRTLPLASFHVKRAWKGLSKLCVMIKLGVFMMTRLACTNTTYKLLKNERIKYTVSCILVLKQSLHSLPAPQLFETGLTRYQSTEQDETPSSRPPKVSLCWSVTVSKLYSQCVWKRFNCWTNDAIYYDYYDYEEL